MHNKSKKLFWVILFILIITVWAKKDEIYTSLKPKPAMESLQFIKQAGSPETASAATLEFQKAGSEKKTVVVSRDEEININVFQKVHAAVVNIATTTLSVNFWMQVTPQQGQGSGFIIDKRGYILTNNHVVENASKITVTLSNGKKLAATLVGRDPESDLAVIKVSDSTINDVVELGDSSSLQVGQKALAIGNPFGLGQTLTQGIVSALHRSIKTEDNTQIDDVIQTDAPINPGNSGGPLLNSNGEAIGINTSIFTTSGGYQGIGFVIPINRAREIAAQLITTGRVARPWLGTAAVVPVKELSDYLDLGIGKGLLLVQIYEKSPADRAGLRGGDKMVIVGRYRLLIGGDIILSIDNNAVSEDDDINRILSMKKIGDKITVKIFRNGKLMDITVSLTEKPQNLN
jgi:S1-C subfamily serine protease